MAEWRFDFARLLMAYCAWSSPKDRMQIDEPELAPANQAIEQGCFVRTPHSAMLGWMTDLLSLWKEAGWGWAMWNLRGGFGVVDRECADVKYENFRGHKLDSELLELIRAHGAAEGPRWSAAWCGTPLGVPRRSPQGRDEGPVHSPSRPSVLPNSW